MDIVCAPRGRAPALRGWVRAPIRHWRTSVWMAWPCRWSGRVGRVRSWRRRAGDEGPTRGRCRASHCRSSRAGRARQGGSQRTRGGEPWRCLLIGQHLHIARREASSTQTCASAAGAAWLAASRAGDRCPGRRIRPSSWFEVQQLAGVARRTGTALGVRGGKRARPRARSSGRPWRAQPPTRRSGPVQRCWRSARSG